VFVNIRSIPINEVVQRILDSARLLDASKAPSKSENFADQLVQAVKGRLSRFHAVTADSSRTADSNSFAEQLKEAVERKTGGLPTQKQHAERVRKERERHLQPPPPPLHP
jgi:hypothetical protein